MEIYTAIEKDNLLKQIAVEEDTPIDSKRSMSIIDEYLYPNGLVEKPTKCYSPEYYACEISQKGIDFLEAGGFSKIQKEEDEMSRVRIEMEKLTTENLRLQNDDLGYKKKIRHQESIIRLHQYIEAVSWIVSAIVTSLLIFSKN